MEIHAIAKMAIQLAPHREVHARSIHLFVDGSHNSDQSTDSW